jgi:hypothetical protein
MALSPLSREERLTKYFHRLGAQRASSTAEEALERVIRTLDEVEDAYSGVSKSEPPPPIGQSDGRMYPPRGDRVILLHCGGIRAQTKGHDIAIGADGGIAITNRATEQIEFQQSGGGKSHGVR